MLRIRLWLPGASVTPQVNHRLTVFQVTRWKLGCQGLSLTGRGQLRTWYSAGWPAWPAWPGKIAVNPNGEFSIELDSVSAGPPGPPCALRPRTLLCNPSKKGFCDTEVIHVLQKQLKREGCRRDKRSKRGCQHTREATRKTRNPIKYLCYEPVNTGAG